MPSRKNHRKERQNKKARTDGHVVSDDVLRGSPYIFSLPFELLAEVCVLTRSPQDVLSLARTSKHFCRILVGNEATSIWRRVRQQCLPSPLPEPISIFTEPAYAAFVFDGGKCENCSDNTRKTYASYSLKARICNKQQCTREFSSKYLFRAPQKDEMEKTILSWIPKLDNTTEIPAPLSHSHPFFYGHQNVVRRLDYDAAVAEHMESTSDIDCTDDTLNRYFETRKKDAARMKSWMKLCDELQTWKARRNLEMKSNHDENLRLSLQICQDEGWNFMHLNNTDAFGDLYRAKNRSLEKLTQLDYDLIKEAVETQMIGQKERRDRRDVDLTQKHNASVIATYYNYLRASSTFAPLPNLRTLKQLPIIHELMTSTVPSKRNGTSKEKAKEKASLTLSSIQKSPVVADLVEKQIAQAREAARAGLATLISPELANWKTASINKKHPVEHVHRRFRCSRCESVGTKFGMDGCLDFKGAFMHTCPRKIKGQVRGEVDWKPDLFKVDEQAGRAIEKLYAAYGVETDSSLSIDDLDHFRPGETLFCLSCTNAAIALKPSSVIGHSHRHEDMKLALVKLSDDIEAAIPELNKGLAATFKAGSSPRLNTLKQLKNYGCRHCLQLRSQHATQENTHVEKFEMLKPDKEIFKVHGALNWNGLRSHLGAKHNVHHVRDEDVFSFDPVNLRNLK